MNRFLRTAAVLAALIGSTFTAHAADTEDKASPKVLRYAFRVAETTLDPAQVNDIYSRILTGHIFEALYTYDHLARPIKFKPLTAEALPEVTDNYRTWTMKVRPGIHFADDPVFGGKKRELVAEDYVYAIKRFADPANKSPVWSNIDGFKLLGLGEQRQKALNEKKAFDYDSPVEGLRALDRYTVQIRLAQPRPRFIEFLAASDLFGGVAREVVQAYGDKIAEHPVGTGPFQLAQWRRASFIALERNPGYRERFYEAEPAEGDAEGQALLARFKGRRIPMIDRVEVSIIEEAQPRWLAFLNGQHNFVEQVPTDYVNQAMPNGKVAPNLAKKGVQGWRQVRADLAATFFNLDDPVVGGYSPEKVALRRAISLGLDVDREIRLVHKGQGFLAQAPIAPHTTSYDPSFKSEMSDYDPARANALLDLYGYLDRDGDGWRDLPDGSPLVLQWSIEAESRGRQMSEQYHRDLSALKINVKFKPGKWPELLKAARAGSFQIWHVGGMSASPDSQGALQRYDGSQVGGQNMARFRRPEFDAIYKRLSELPDGPEREAQFAEARRLAVAWMPYRIRYHSYITDMAQAEVIGYRRPQFWLDWWQYVDVVTAAKTPK
ncbi:MAG TPA: ABC transporter substrate-binding protein [Ideonella sp.]|uniref:ABC transporter substrate-binding protein n=1 Tax=Ideonella sp. TaxID=1929293 RepID=UPI002E3181EE|nr:ABC transporter substrate-binding protein [Ideonella sp.]HEX5687335.1 ABC transporter substrate-binding protein [Ideonella sp.]